MFYRLRFVYFFLMIITTLENVDIISFRQSTLPSGSMLSENIFICNISMFGLWHEHLPSKNIINMNNI